MLFRILEPQRSDHRHKVFYLPKQSLTIHLARGFLYAPLCTKCTVGNVVWRVKQLSLSSRSTALSLLFLTEVVFIVLLCTSYCHDFHEAYLSAKNIKICQMADTNIESGLTDKADVLCITKQAYGRYGRNRTRRALNFGSEKI